MSDRELKLPVELYEDPNWPWHVQILDATRKVLMDEFRAAHSTKAKTLEQVWLGKGMGADIDEAVELNAEQLAKFNQIIVAVNSHQPLIDALEELHKASHAVCQISDRENVHWDRLKSALLEAETIISQAKAPSLNQKGDG